MDLPPSPKQIDFIAGSEIHSTDRLLESGILCLRQRRYVEGLAFLALAREKLSSDQVQLAAVLDAFAQSHTSYLRTQEELLEASRKFARADTEQLAQIAALENLLPAASGAPEPILPQAERLQLPAKGRRLLHILQSPSGDLPNGQSTGQLPLENSDDKAHQPLVSSVGSQSLPGLYITCFGHFKVKRLNKTVDLCTNRHARTVLRYLVVHVEHCATSDTLMALLWPEDEPEVAQPRLHTSICALRRSLNADYVSKSGAGYIICKNRTYYLNPAIPIQTDAEQFLYYYQLGRQSEEERISLYKKACQLYTGPFLSEDRYADWSSLQREHLTRLYVDMSRMLSEHYLKVSKYEEAEIWANAVLKENRCDELAYQQLMRIYAAQGCRSEALRHYQRCECVLREELAVAPMPETVQIMQMLLKGGPSSD